MQALTDAFALQERMPLAEKLRAAGVPAGEVNSVAEILADAHVQARGIVGAFDHPEEGEVPALRTPFKVAGQDYPEPAAAPVLGADTDRVLSERLGYSADDIRSLREERII